MSNAAAGGHGMMAAMTAYQSATMMAWDLAGRPRRDPPPLIPDPGTCAVCGALADETVPASRTIGNKTYTDQYLLADRAGMVTCCGCAWAMPGKPPRALRLWTVACAPGEDLGPSHPKAVLCVAGDHPGLLLTARNDMRPVARLLARPPDGPWCAAVAESGQKHTLPYAPVNHGPGRWQVRMDAADVAAAPADFRTGLAASARLRQAGFTAAEIITLTPPAGRLTAATLPVWRQNAALLAPWRASALLRLANFMINKEHMDEYAAYAA